MVDRLEENQGKYPYVTLAQVKDYLSISSNTQDARLSNIINYATGVVEHYIGQEILANDYVEVFDGGKSSVMISRLPLSNVYQVSEFNGTEDVILADPTTIGRPVRTQDTQAVSLTFKNDAHLNSRVKKFGKSSLEVALNDLVSGDIPENLEFEDGDFTVELFVRSDAATPPQNNLIRFNTDATNYMEFGFDANDTTIFQSRFGGPSTLVRGTGVTTTANYVPRFFTHVAWSFDSQYQRLYTHLNGNLFTNASYTESNHTFTANVEIGGNFAGYIDEVRFSNKARYKEATITPPTHRFRPDGETVFLCHFDGSNKATEATDAHNATNEYNFSRDMGEVTRDTGAVGVRGTYPTVRNSYPALTLSGPPGFAPFPSGIKVDYRAGYESGEIPQDIQLATLDMIKLIYKQDQEKKGFSFEGERGDNYPLAGNFPPHIRRILDLYRIVA
jgi:hypothetical protein